MDKVIEILCNCGVTVKYKGYHYLVEAIQIAETCEERTFVMGKDIYPEIAKEYDTSWHSVERNIRTVIEKCWKNNQAYMNQIMGYPTTKCPSNKDFIATIVFHSNRKK